MIHCAAINITGNRVYELGEISGINCSAEVPVQSIQWLDGSSGVVREGTSVQELVLDLTIAASHNDSRYTCRISQGTFVESQMITISTGRKNFNNNSMSCFLLRAHWLIVASLFAFLAANFPLVDISL